MDEIRFDALTRFLTSPSRRSIVTAVATAAGAALLGRVAPDATFAKKKKKKTLCHAGQTIKVAKSTVKAHLAHGDILGRCPSPARAPPPAGCPSGTRDCAGECIPTDECCVGGTRLANGGTFNQCGLCVDGQVRPTATCDELDPDGCHECDPRRFQCEPGHEGQRCAVSCGVCTGGLCDPAGGWTECPGALSSCAPEQDCFPGAGANGCCPAGQDCCLQLAIGQNGCISSVPGCGRCQFSCGTICCDFDRHDRCCAGAGGSLECSGTPCPTG